MTWASKLFEKPIGFPNSWTVEHIKFWVESFEDNKEDLIFAVLEKEKGINKKYPELEPYYSTHKRTMERLMEQARAWRELVESCGKVLE